MKTLSKILNMFNHYDPKTKKNILNFLKILILIFIISTIIHSINIHFAQKRNTPKTHLVVLWTSADLEVANNACLMYTHAAKRAKWFDEVTLIVWGPSAQLLSQDNQIRQKVKSMAADGVCLQACITCTDSYGVTSQIQNLGIEVKPMGKPLSDMIHQGWKILTF